MKILLPILLFLISFSAYSQTGNPSPKSNTRAEYAFVQSDSAEIIAKRDTNWTPTYAGTLVFWQHVGVDSSLWLYNGVKWNRYLNDRDVTNNNNGSGIRYFKTLASFQSATFALDEVSILDDSVYGGGLFTAHSIGEGLVADTAFVFKTANSSIVNVRKIYDPNIVKMDWFNVKKGFNTNFMPAFVKAEAYLSPRGGGQILFGQGDFLASPQFSIDQDNIHVKGAGSGSTKIYSTTSGAGLMVNSSYRDAGWLISGSQLITYDDANLRIGQKYLDLRVSGDAALLPKGTKIFISAGANYFDQNYGEFNIVDSVIGSRIYLKYGLSRDYTQSRSSWGATLTANFTPPAPNATATLNFIGVNGISLPVGYPISIGNDLYVVQSSTTSSATVLNVSGKGNGSSVIPSGTHIFKYRAIARTPQTVYNTSVEDMTIDGIRKALVVSNTIKTYFKGVIFNWHPANPFSGGLTIDGDDGRDFLMENCEVHADYYMGMQFARSFTGINISHSKFFNAAFQISEFNSDVNVTKNEFHLAYSGLNNETSQQAILLGNSCQNINFSDNWIWASNLPSVFYTGEIQGPTTSGNTSVSIVGNHIFADNVSRIFSGGFFGSIYIVGNTIVGSTGQFGGMYAAKFDSASYTTTPSLKFGFGAESIIRDNYFSGLIDGFADPNSNVQYINNYINRQGTAGTQSEYDTWGNVFYTHHPVDSIAENFVFKDNTLKGWNLRTNSMSLIGFGLGKRTEICNNKFFDMVGSYAATKDSIVDMICAGETNVPIDLPYLGTATPRPQWSANFIYNHLLNRLGVNTPSPQFNIDVTGTSHFYNGQMTLQDAAFYSYSQNSAASTSIPAAINPGYSRKQKFDVNNQVWQLSNGNTDGVGFQIIRGQGIGVSNYAYTTFISGSTIDNSGNYRPGYNVWQLGDGTGALYTHHIDDSLGWHLNRGKVFLNSTIIPTGTTGNQTINSATGKVNFAASSSTLTVTNNLVTTTCMVTVQVEGTDPTAKSATVTLSNGSFIITLNAAATAETRVSFEVKNQ